MRRVIALCAALAAAGVVAAVAVVLLTGGEDRPAPVSGREARGLLDQAVEAARAGDDGRLCELARAKSMCRQFLEEARDESYARPSLAPVVVGSRIVPEAKDRPAFRVLDLRITVPGREPYDTEFPVVRDEEALSSLNPVYWSPTNWH